jgi:SPP1 gp7 family putative phage head morphogenesis protein
MATTHRRQADLELILDQMDAALRSRWANLVRRVIHAWRSASPAERHTRLTMLLNRTVDDLLQELSVALSAGRDAQQKAMAQALPSALLPVLLGRLSTPEQLLENEVAGLVPQPPRDRPEALTPAEARAKIAALALPPLPAKRVREIFKKRPLSTAQNTLADRLSQLLWTPRVISQIETGLVSGLASGENVDQLTKRIRGVTSSATYQARRIARTEGRRTLERDHLERSTAALGDLVVGIMYTAVMDDRTRPEHAALHGTIFTKDEFGGFRDRQGRLAPELPDGANCRCSYVPVLKEPDLPEPDRLAFETTTIRLVPDLPTYQQVWEQASVATRRRMIGATRYDLLRERFGSADPTLALTIDGRLASLELIRRETVVDAYERRTMLLTRRAIGGGGYSERSDAVGTAQGQAIANRVLARTDLPVGLSKDRLAAELTRLVPTPPPNASPADREAAAKAVAEQFTQLAALSPEAKLTDLTAQIFRVIGRQNKIPAAVDVRSQTALEQPMRTKIGQAVSLAKSLIPGKKLDLTIQLHPPPYRANYSPVDKVVNLSEDNALEIIFHEILHAIDFEFFEKRFGDKYAADKLTKSVIASGGEEYQTRKDGSPGLYYYQNRKYSSGRGLEFITTMGEQLVRNPLLAITGDPKGFSLWLKQFHDLK